MKRLLILATAAVLVLGLAAATYADIEWGASGFVRVRSAWYMNAVNPNLGVAPFITPGPVAFVNPAFDKSNAWMDTRFRLKFSAKANDVATGVIYFEGDSSRWGEVAGAGAQRNQAGQWGADRAAIELKQMYIDFKVPGTDAAPTSVKAGIIGFANFGHLSLGHTLPVFLLVNLAIPPDIHTAPRGECVYHRSTYTVQSA